MQNQQQISEVAATSFPFAIIQVLLWKWRDFLGNNSACLTLSCIWLLIPGACSCSVSRSQLATYSRAEMSSCFLSDRRRGTGTSVALSNWLLCKLKLYFYEETNLCCLSVRCCTWKTGDGSTVLWACTGLFLLQLVAFFPHFFFSGYRGKRFYFLHTAACRSELWPSNCNRSCCFVYFRAPFIWKSLVSNAVTQEGFWQSFRNGAYSLKCFLKLSSLQSTDIANGVEAKGNCTVGFQVFAF